MKRRMAWWSVMATALWHLTGCGMPGKSFSGALPPLTEGQRKLAGEIRRDVQVLAGEIGHRDLEHPELLARAADHVEGQFRAAGFEPRQHQYEVGGQTYTSERYRFLGGSSKCPAGPPDVVRARDDLPSQHSS